MHNPVKAVIVAMSILVLCSCNSGINIKIDERSYQTETGSAEIRIPEFSSDTSGEFVQSINDIYNKEASALVDAFFDKYPTGEKKSELNLDTMVTRNDGRIVSVIVEGEAFWGGAHGEKIRIAKSFDFQKEEQILLESLFEDDSWKMVADNKMQSLAQKGEGEYKDLWEIPSTKRLKNENFYLKDNVLVLYFPPYELSYYRRGYVEFEFTREELAGHLSNYGRELLGA